MEKVLRKGYNTTYNKYAEVAYFAYAGSPAIGGYPNTLIRTTILYIGAKKKAPLLPFSFLV